VLSAAYYAVFHFVVTEGADLFIGRGNPKNLKSPPPEFGAERARRAAEAPPMTEAERRGLAPIY
jgi:hypothetical protein